MTDVVLYHHIQGLTEGVRSFANELRQAGHTIHTPDLFDGRTFATMDEAFAFVREAGDALDAKADSAAQALPEGMVYAGISWGVGAAQRLAQTRPARVGRFSTKPASRSPANTPSVHGPTTCPFKSTARRTTSSSHTRATSMLPASWSLRSGRTRPNCSCTPATSTSSSTPRFPPTTPTRRHW